MRNDDVIVFTGPTIRQVEAEEFLTARYCPPAKQGDIYRAYIKYQPSIMALIDGNFENTPSPWHKEILFVMEQGVHVYGASSMGALRAAELSMYGMIGIGEIFKAYHSKRIEDDDEVALIHGPSKLGYPNLSEAMVNIRKTLESAYFDQIIGHRLYVEALNFSKRSFYADRNYGALIDHFSKNVLFEEEITAFGIWLKCHRRDQKKDDAIILLKLLAKKRINSFPLSVNYKLEKTVFWNEMCKQVEAEPV